MLYLYLFCKKNMLRYKQHAIKQRIVIIGFLAAINYTAFTKKNFLEKKLICAIKLVYLLVPYKYPEFICFDDALSLYATLKD